MRNPPRPLRLLLALAALLLGACTTDFALRPRPADAGLDAADALADVPDVSDARVCRAAGDLCCMEAARGSYCVGGLVCSEGFCAPCPGTLFACGNACVDIQTNGRHCGGCDTVCAAGQRCAAGSCELDCPAPSTVCGSACVSLMTDPANCGACGSSCAAASAQHQTGLCVAGACDRACEAGYDDCDDNPANGCEVDLLHDPAHCGACGQVCAPARAVGACVAGACTVATCNNGYANCDGVVGNGCEVDANRDTMFCGGCATRCTAGQNCVAGSCHTAMVACTGGHAECVAGDGVDCETPIASDVNNCGACGRTCAYSHAAATCALGVCTPGACASGYADCNGNRNDGCEARVASDVANCGACGRACTADHGVAACAAGACAVQSCESSYADCDGMAANGCEADTGTSAPNCGGCGRACAPPNAAGACVGGRCSVGACNAGFADCDGNASNGCEVDLNTSTVNCGTCSYLCASPNARSSCVGGSCALGDCNAGFRNCDGAAGNGCETNVNTSAASCGECGHACSFANASSSCAAGACVLGACTAGWGNCDGDPSNGCEASLSWSGASCGACGHSCPSGQSCSAGACVTVCPAAQVLCANACVDTNSNVSHCGGCGNACPSGPNEVALCAEGQCRRRCVDPYGNCDGNAVNGCETDLTSSTTNCGACGLGCASPPHATGACNGRVCGFVCVGAYGNCDGNAANGCEAQLATDLANCGACGRACPPAGAVHVMSAVCSGGPCQLTCADGYGDCNRDPADGCETSLDDTAHCGACEATCANGQIGVTPTQCCVYLGDAMCCGGGVIDSGTCVRYRRFGVCM